MTLRSLDDWDDPDWAERERAFGERLEAAPPGAEPRPLERALLGDLVRDGVPEPTMVHDWLYAGGLHSLQAEPEAGKSWLALLLCLELLGAGYSVIYLDEEGGEELVAERLEALGADPDQLDRCFFYFPFPGRAWLPSDVEALSVVVAEARATAPRGLGMAVLDSLPDFLDAAGKDEDRARDVTGFVRTMLPPLREVGAALLVLDHLGKPEPGNGEKKRSRYSRGSGAKLAKADLTLLLENVTPFNRTTSGQVRLFQTKDRRGAVDLPRLFHSTGLLIDVKVGGGRVEFVKRPGAVVEPVFDGNAKIDRAILAYLAVRAGEEFSANAIMDGLKRTLGRGFGRQAVLDAVKRLADTQQCRGAQGAYSHLAEADRSQQVVIGDEDEEDRW